MDTEKFILDACCGGRMFWFDKHQPNTIYIDNNPRARGISKLRPEFCCQPDVVMDFTNLKFEDLKFRLVVWDPPHLKTLSETSEMRRKYGCLNGDTWQYDLKKGFSECWRVLQDYGILVFKWNEAEIPLKKVLSLFSEQPLFGHTTGSKSKTHWLCFMKIPSESSSQSLKTGFHDSPLDTSRCPCPPSSPKERGSRAQGERARHDDVRES